MCVGTLTPAYLEPPALKALVDEAPAPMLLIVNPANGPGPSVGPGVPARDRARPGERSARARVRRDHVRPARQRQCRGRRRALPRVVRGGRDLPRRGRPRRASISRTTWRSGEPSATRSSCSTRAWCPRAATSRWPTSWSRTRGRSRTMRGGSRWSPRGCATCRRPRPPTSCTRPRATRPARCSPRHRAPARCTSPRARSRTPGARRLPICVKSKRARSSACSAP